MTPEIPQITPAKSGISKKRLVLILGFIIILASAVSVFTFSHRFPPNFKATAPVKPQMPLAAATVVEKEQKLQEVIGFLPSWIPLDSVDLDGKNLTQIIYFGLGVTSNGEIIKYNEENNPVIEWNIFTSADFRNFTRAAHNRNIKIILALKNFDNASIDTLISNTAATERLARELVVLARKYELDGFNLDFEYVTDSEFPTKPYFNKFLEKIRQTLTESDPELSLSIDVNALATASDAAYDMPKIGEIVDWIIVMGYDYHLTTSTLAGPVAPLYSSGNSHSVSKTVDGLSGKVPFKKVILGIPFYGYEWATINKSWGSPTITGSGALATYKRVKKLLENNVNVKQHWDMRSQGPWLEYMEGSTIKQIYYEDAQSIAAKVGFVRDHSMAGVAIWTLGYEGENTDIWSAITE